IRAATYSTPADSLCRCGTPTTRHAYTYSRPTVALWVGVAVAVAVAVGVGVGVGVGDACTSNASISAHSKCRRRQPLHLHLHLRRQLLQRRRPPIERLWVESRCKRVGWSVSRIGTSCRRGWSMWPRG